MTAFAKILGCPVVELLPQLNSTKLSETTLSGYEQHSSLARAKVNKRAFATIFYRKVPENAARTLRAYRKVMEIYLVLWPTQDLLFLVLCRSVYAVIEIEPPILQNNTQIYNALHARHSLDGMPQDNWVRNGHHYFSPIEKLIKVVLRLKKQFHFVEHSRHHLGAQGNIPGADEGPES
jgi:hypothetical protein